MVEITIVVYTMLFIIWLTGAIVSLSQSQAHRWHYPKLRERIVLAILWPLDLLLNCWALLKWAKRNITGK